MTVEIIQATDTTGEMPEFELLLGAYALSDRSLYYDARFKFAELIAITKLFSRENPATHDYEMISEGRAFSIIAISDWWAKHILPVRGLVTYAEIHDHWEENIPDDLNLHPDDKFDIAQASIMGITYDGSGISKLDLAVARQKLTQDTWHSDVNFYSGNSDGIDMLLELGYKEGETVKLIEKYAAKVALTDILPDTIVS